MPASDPFVLSAEKYKFWVIDHTRRQVTIVPQNGDAVTSPLEGDLSVSGIKLSVFDWEKWWITTVTERGHLVITAGFNPEGPDRGPHRPTIYLDQNKWSLLGAALLAPERVRDKQELLAARELIRLAKDDGVILPLSSAHLLETSALHTDLRYEVGVAIASLSGGWQMRHPLNIFQQEAIDALGRRLSMETASRSDKAMITTEPNAWQQRSAVLGLGPRRAGNTELFLEMLSAPGAIISMLVDPAPLERASVSGWVKYHQRITQQFQSLDSPKSKKRAVALRRFWNEHLSMYRSVWATSLEQRDFPTFSNRELRKIMAEGPMTSLLCDLFVTRFIDGTNRWHGNDLVDMMYLACGAAYCDYVVGEVKTCTHLTQIQRSQGKPGNVFRTLHALVDRLHVDGVSTDTERRAVTSEPDAE